MPDPTQDNHHALIDACDYYLKECYRGLQTLITKPTLAQVQPSPGVSRSAAAIAHVRAALDILASEEAVVDGLREALENAEYGHSVWPAGFTLNAMPARFREVYAHALLVNQTHYAVEKSRVALERLPDAAPPVAAPPVATKPTLRLIDAGPLGSRH